MCHFNGSKPRCYGWMTLRRCLEVLLAYPQDLAWESALSSFFDAWSLNFLVCFKVFSFFLSFIPSFLSFLARLRCTLVYTMGLRLRLHSLLCAMFAQIDLSFSSLLSSTCSSPSLSWSFFLLKVLDRAAPAATRSHLTSEESGEDSCGSFAGHFCVWLGWRLLASGTASAPALLRFLF